MIIPLWAALALFALIVLGIVLFGFLQSLTLFSFGPSLMAFAGVVAFWAAVAFVLLWTATAVGASDWSAPLIDFDSFFSASPF